MKPSKILLVLFICFWYFFSGSLLSKLIYHFECREYIPYIHMLGTNFDIIDLHVLHIPAFIALGMMFGSISLAFAPIAEVIQNIVKHSPIRIGDMMLNVASAWIGAFIMRLKLKEKGEL